MQKKCVHHKLKIIFLLNNSYKMTPCCVVLVNMIKNKLTSYCKLHKPLVY